MARGGADIGGNIRFTGLLILRQRRFSGGQPADLTA